MSRSLFLPLAIFCVLATAGFGRADVEIDHLFAEGNAAYSRGDYPGAIAHYEAVTTRAGYSAAVLYNLANSHALAGNTGLAVLHYLQALRLRPGDPDIAGNLALLRSDRGLFPPKTGPAARAMDLLTLPQYSLLALSIPALLALAALLGFRYRLSRRLRLGLVSLTLLLFAFALTGAVRHYRLFDPAVVVQADARLLISPFPAAASAGTIQEGRLVYPEKRYNDFQLVSDETGRRGWLPTTAFARVQGTFPPMARDPEDAGGR